MHHTVRDNPRNQCPVPYLTEIVGISVPFIDQTKTTHYGIIEVHSSIAQDVTDFFTLAYQIDFPITTVTPASDPRYAFNDTVLMEANASSGFNYRLIVGTDKPSLHGLGLAIDINPLLNPCTYFYPDGSIKAQAPQKGHYDTSIPGTFTANHPLVTFMKSRGWEWDGDWTKESGRIDRHHFQKG